MAMADYWLARCHVMAYSPSARRWEEEADEAVTVAAVLAEDADEVRALLQQQCHDDGLGLIRLDAIETLLQRCRREGIAHGLVELAHTTSSQHPVAYGEMLPLLPEKVPEPPPAVILPPVNYQETTWQALFAPHQPPLWAVIDGVNCREAMQRLSQADDQHTCLYASTDTATQANAPWLVRLEADSDLREWLEGLPQDQHWGILLQSNATLKQLRSHLRKFTMLWTPANDQAPVYFRFYDPRVALDMSQALEPWKLAALMAPIETVMVPASPLMVFPAELTLTPAIELDADANDVQGRLVRIELSDDARAANGQGRQFAIGQAEYQHFGELTQSRASQALARSLKERYPQVSEGERTRAVIDATQLGERYGLASKKQIQTLVICVLEVGADFAHRHPDAQRILDNAKLAGWRKCQLLEEWLPRGRLRHALLAPYQQAGQHEDNYRPIADEERP
ncbi:MULTISPECIES: DUF4123 domain-containing protein [Halomonadaceae]|uniref:DUF4123 domain-containing protein n=1 Tax=Halomonadaceae TaxID=28256 RepID=UPI0012F3A228|nr:MULTISPECIES: DUF4123 domain-containing protein [Halomonas]CAD5248137.1 conserved hypothetical protein [Halomonas sp. 156]CAD5265445.1 conserved hypothetical protein [Halomonas sp. 113]CAD5267538.1 conserved hypothetical protein [Halomonas sp. 59]CAD5280093.1 conserved hypothetical protein [Halomonas sp. I3]VXB61966.1 conserved hypothetical protein [Halomonas titanicae]